MSQQFSFLLDQVSAEKLVSSIPYADYLGICIEQDINGQIRYRLPFQEKHIGNPMIRAIHGGVIAGFMECAASLAVIGIIAHDHLPKCVNMTTEYLRSAKAEDAFAQVAIKNSGRRIVHLSVHCWQEDHRQVSAGHYRFRVT
ncbi:MAG: PaaI family thioesterase [Pseudomonadota bacterium]|nr:PaaI family thioesterase [Pseudomonadota bacterium]